MRKFKLILFVLFLFSSMYVFSEIIEISSIEDILPHIDSETLVVFDIDNTLITPKQMLGADKWFQNTIHHYIKEGYSSEEAHIKLLPTFINIQKMTEVALVEPIISSIIHTLQKKGHFVMALTARHSELAHKTVEQLASVNICFSKNPPMCKRLKLNSYYPLSYVEGILFVSRRNKGQLLFALAKELNFEIQKICFVDDKLIYLQQMDQVCKQNRIPFIGFRYKGCDERANKFDPDIANVQLKYLGEILSNEDANKILQEKIKESL